MVPADLPQPDASQVVTVAPGDCLSAYAATYLGSAARWPDIYETNKGRPQSDGGTLADPNLIHVGWSIRIPTAGKPAGDDTAGNDPGDDTGEQPVGTAKSATLIAFARAQLGDPYRWGGTGPNVWDCSGLVQAAAKAAGITLGRTSQAQAGAGHGVSVADIRPGDLVLYYAGASHVGIYLGDEKIIHAPRPGKRVEIAALRSMPIHSVRRILPDAPASVPATQVSPAATVAGAKAAAAGALGATQFQCLANIVARESGWNPSATNAASGAYGLPQALPASKLASAGPDWRTNPSTQLTWMIGYVNERYGSPCGAWSFWQAHSWY